MIDMRDIIQQIRLKAGLSRASFANELKVTVAAISNYENGIRAPQIPIAYKIIRMARIYGLDVSLEDIYPPEKHLTLKK